MVDRFVSLIYSWYVFDFHFMKKFWFSAIFLSMLFGNFLECSSVLQDRLKNAKPGDFIVTEANKMISVLAIRAITSRTLILEEITAPAQAIAPLPASWAEWVRHRAPGHTSWSMLEIDFENNQLIECYSFSRSAWVQLSTQQSFISTILGLSLSPVPQSEQRRIGPEPMNGEADTRKIWQPPLIQNGIHLPGAEFEVYRATWPKDGSDLAGNSVFLYFDQAKLSPFPVWIQMTTAHAAASIRMIDFGTLLPAHYRTLPRRVPELIDIVQKTPAGLSLSIKSPTYYRNFELFAVDVTSTDKEIIPISHTLVCGDGEILHMEIDKSELKNTLQPNHRYTWLIVPIGHCEYYTESIKPFLWKAE
jgi:hypothetical protein